MKQRKLITLLLVMLLPLAMMAKSTTIRQQMDMLHQTKNVNFLYNSSIHVDGEYNGPSLKGLPINKALEKLFEGTGVSYEVKDNYILLKKATKSVSPKPEKNHSDKTKRKYTLSGYVKDESGETLINATILDETTGLATMTNAYGFYSITLPEGSHQIKCSYIGFSDEIKTIEIQNSNHYNFTMREDAKIAEVVVTGDLNSPLLTTQTGKRSLGQSNIKTGYSLLSSPDVIKTLQRTSGVSEGIELSSGLYVHGGNNDENLFLIDGTPLYQVNHTLGIFSSFNPDVVKNVDFYKSGFPARYGGRLSSVTDVRTNDGNFYHTHGSYRIGLLDGSFQLEGPIANTKFSCIRLHLNTIGLLILLIPIMTGRNMV